MRALQVILALLVLAPFMALAAFALEPVAGGGATWSPALESVVRSTGLGLAVSAITASAGFSLAYLVTHRRFACRRLIRTLAVLPLLFPPFVLASLYAELFSSTGPFATSVAGWLPAINLRGAGGFVLCMSLSLFPFPYLLCRMALEEHGEAPFDLGCSIGLGRRPALRRIVLPLCMPAVLLGALLVFMQTVGDWATASVLSVRTTSVVLHELWFARERPHFVARFSLLLTLVVLGLLVACARKLPSLRHAFGQLLRPPEVEAPRSGGRGALLACSLPVLLGFVVPLAATVMLLMSSLRRIDLSRLRLSCWHSLLLVLAAGLGAGLIVAALTCSHQLRPGRLVRLSSWWLVLSYLVPVMVFAAAMLLLGQRLAIERSSIASFSILGYAVALRYACFLLVPIGVGISSLAASSDDLARSLGMDAARSFRSLHAPHLKRFALLGLLLVVLQSLREVALTVWLRPFGFEPIAAKVYALVRIDMLPESSGWVLALVLLGMGPLLLLDGMVSERGAERRTRAQARRAVAQGR